MKKLTAILATFATVCLLAAGSSHAGEPCAGKGSKNISISPEGVFLKEGKPFRGIGLDYFTAFFRRLENPQDTSYREGFKVLGRRKIPFVRMMAGGFWPNNYKLYLKDKEAYLRQMDDVVKAAEENHVGLVCSLFWYFPTFPDLVGEHVNQWGNSKSKTHAFMRQYIKDVVGRYKDSPAIWGWEFGNEVCLLGDLPNAADQRPFVRPDFGTPKLRTAEDELTQAMIKVAQVEFAKAVHESDPNHLIVSGNSMPRAFSFHNTLDQSWGEDTRNQFAEILLRDNPDPMNVVSVHLYSEPDNMFFAERKVQLNELLKEVTTIAALVKKPVIVGEIGAPSDLGPTKERALIVKLLQAVEENKVPMAAVWDFDRSDNDKQWNITETNGRAYMLDLIGQANARMAKQVASENKKKRSFLRFFGLGH